jgi:hypothetical protein
MRTVFLWPEIRKIKPTLGFDFNIAIAVKKLVTGDVGKKQLLVVNDFDKPGRPPLGEASQSPPALWWPSRTRASGG